MAVVAFKWGEKQLMLMQNRENWESCPVNVADWDEERQILGGFYGQNGGTWCGISKRGRVAFLVDVMPFDNVSRCELIPLAFLKGALTPEEFGNSVVAERVMYNGLAFHLVVGDIKSNSMVYIAKRHAQEAHVEKNNVEPGIHILSLAGLDPAPQQFERLRQEFSAVVAGNEDIQPPHLEEFALRVMTNRDGNNPLFYDITRAIPQRRTVEARIGISSTTALVVKPNGDGLFYKRALANSEWIDKRETFHIDD